MASVLIVDDHPLTAGKLRRFFQDENITVFSAGSVAEARETVGCRRPDVVMLNDGLPDGTGLAAFEEIRRVDAAVPIIFLAESNTSYTAIEAMRLGALDCLLKPLDLSHVRGVVEQALKVSNPLSADVKICELCETGETGSDHLIGRCPAMQEVYKAIGRVAQYDVNVLIRGESGTGKELVARAIYQHSPRAKKTFLAINCSAIPETLLESELFGHEKGAFTGAVARRTGKFEQCDGGTLFLDEIGDMTPLMQSKVLRTIQEKQFERVGGNETIHTDVWIIAATNRDLEAMVAKGDFRADLFYRLNGYGISLPPLRERGDDIPLLVAHLLRRYNRELGKSVDKIAPEAMDALIRYSWPGNVRELQSVLKQAILVASGPILLPEFLPLARHEATQAATPASSLKQDGETSLEAFIEEHLDQGTSSLYADCLAYMERNLVARTLRRTEGNLSRAAALLGITRGSLRNKAKTYGITVNRAVDVTDGDVDPLRPTVVDACESEPLQPVAS